jgi:hypothetical protein
LGEGETYEELRESLKSLPEQVFFREGGGDCYSTNTFTKEKILAGLSWKMDFTAFGRGYLREEQLEKMHR